MEKSEYAEKEDFDQRTACKAPVGWSKYTTNYVTQCGKEGIALGVTAGSKIQGIEGLCRGSEDLITCVFLTYDGPYNVFHYSLESISFLFCHICSTLCPQPHHNKQEFHPVPLH